ncbi:hypothetical protein BGZ95_007101, partial [Linnemannia exigua]
MKFFSSSSFTVLVLTLTAVKAQTAINIKDYPAINQVPPIDSPEVKAWLQEIGDLSGAPSIPLHKGEPPSCPNPPIPN